MKTVRNYYMSEQTLDISWNTIAKVLIAGLCLYMLFVAKEIVTWFFWEAMFVF